MTSRSGSARGRALPAFLVFFLAGAAMLALALPSLLPTVGAIARRAPLIAFSARDVIGLPLSIPFFAFAGMTLLPAPDVRPGARRKRAGKAGRDWAAVLLGVAVAGAALTLFAAPIAQAVMDGAMRRRDYLRCPEAPSLAHAPPARWVLPNSVVRCFHS